MTTIHIKKCACGHTADVEDVYQQGRADAIDELYNLVTKQMIEWNTDLDFNLDTQNKILDLRYGQIKE